MTTQILNILKNTTKADICHISESIRQQWHITIHGLKTLTAQGLITPTTSLHPTYSITQAGLQALQQ